MTKRVQRLGMDAATLANFKGMIRELIVDTTNFTLNVHDGATPGGVALARADLSNVDAATNLAAGKMSAQQVANLLTAQSNITTLQNELNAAEANIVTLQNELDAAEASIAARQPLVYKNNLSVGQTLSAFNKIAWASADDEITENTATWANGSTSLIATFTGLALVVANLSFVFPVVFNAGGAIFRLGKNGAGFAEGILTEPPLDGIFWLSLSGIVAVTAGDTFDVRYTPLDQGASQQDINMQGGTDISFTRL